MIVLLPERSVQEPLLWHSAPGTRKFAVAPPKGEQNEEQMSDEDIQMLSLSSRYLRTSEKMLAAYPNIIISSEEEKSPTQGTSLISSSNTSSINAPEADHDNVMQQLCLHGVKLERLAPHLKMLSSLGHRKDEHRNVVTCAYRKMNVERTPEIEKRLKQFLRENDDKPFPYPPKSAWDEYALGQRGMESGTDSYYCAEIIATTYMSMGLLRKDKPANAYMPTHFSSEHPETPFVVGVTFDAEIWFDIDTVQDVSA
jgi:hypothetical protein